MKLLQLRLDEYLEEPISFSLDVPREGVILTGVSGTGKTQAIDLIKCAAEQQNLSVFVPDSDLSLAKFSEKPPEELTLAILDSDMLPSSEVFDLFKAAQAKDNLYAVWISRGESLFDRISSPILIPYRTKYTYTFTHKFEYDQPSIENLRIDDAICLTEDSGAGKTYFELVFPAVISSVGSSRLGSLLKAIGFCSKKHIVVIADRDTWGYLKPVLQTLSTDVNVYVLLHSSTEAMISQISPLIAKMYSEVLETLTYQEVKDYISANYKTSYLTSERVDSAVLWHQLAKTDMPLKDICLKASSTLSPANMLISDKEVAEYIYAGLKCQVIASDTVLTAQPSADNRMYELRDHLFSPPEPQDLDSD